MQFGLPGSCEHWCPKGSNRGLSANQNARALISMMARSKCSNQRPDTLMQDRSLPARRNHLQRTAGPYMVGQTLAAAHPEEATAMMSACIVAAQAVMLPIALLVGRTADSWGRKPLFLTGFAILPIRAVLYTFSDNSFWLIGVQLLDGVGAGIFGALTPLVIADIMRGTGRYNLALGAVATMQGIGASLSGLAAGVIVDHLGYIAAFLTLGAAAGVALIVFALGMPETADRETAPRQS